MEHNTQPTNHQSETAPQPVALPSMSSWRVILSSGIIAALLVYFAVRALPQGSIGRSILSLALALAYALVSWVAYLERKLSQQGIAPWSERDLTSLSRQLGSRERRLLVRWELSFLGLVVAAPVLLLVFAVVVAVSLVNGTLWQSLVGGGPLLVLLILFCFWVFLHFARLIVSQTSTGR